MLVSLLLILLQVCSQLMTAVAIPTCLLNGHGGSFPVSCLPVNINISFPSSALPAAASANPLQCRKALWVVYESLQEAGLVFEEDLPAGLTWRDEKLQRFRHLQFRLMEEGQCFWSSSAVCGWEALRRDLLWVLKSALHQHHNCFTWGTKTPPTSG
ncbi:hypothetical protein KUCAC02_034571 [Chaenocephalus aceratus]|nr:hypothetical protein KUCAC02_034571 [Chaenocephalus aceratus]